MICRTSTTHSLLCVLASASYFRFTQEIFIQKRLGWATAKPSQARFTEVRVCTESLIKRRRPWIPVCCLQLWYASQHCCWGCHCHSLLCRINQDYPVLHSLFEWLLGLHYYSLTCTSHTAQSWQPAPPRRCWCCPRRESPPSAWLAHPAGPAAFGRWTGSPHAAHTGPQAVADCHLQSCSTRMYRHIPRPGTGTWWSKEKKGGLIHSSGGRGNQECSWQKGYELLNMLLQFVLSVLPVSAPQWLCG